MCRYASVYLEDCLPFFMLTQLSHTSLLVTSCHSFSRSMVFRMPYATDVMLFLMDDSAEDRVDTETERVPSLDRMSLSVKNHWLDEQSRVYIIFTTEEIMEALSCANQKACRLMLELEKDAGLIERKRQGLGKPSLIYVKNFAVSS